MSQREPRGEASAWARATATAPVDQAAQDRARRRAGILLGAALGLAYGGVSQLINRVALPGIPLFQPPLGAVGNIVLSGLVGGLFGLLTCWPVSMGKGILLGCAAALVAICASVLARLGGQERAASLVASVVLSAPLAWLTVPLLALLRWIAGRQLVLAQRREALLVRGRAPVALVLALGLLASFELLPGRGQDDLRRMEALLQARWQAPSAANWPAALTGPRVTNLPPQPARHNLEWTQTDLDRFMELRPPSNFYQHAAVITRFSDAATLVCLFPAPGQEPTCANYERLPEGASQVSE